MVSYSFTSPIHELGLGTSLCFHETNPFVVQPYEPIPLIVLPYRLLVCSKSSKPSRLGPWHPRNHYTMDSSPNSSWREHNNSLPIVRSTHVITILRTSRPLVVDENSTSSMPIMCPTIKHIPDPLLDLVLQVQTVHKHMTPCHSCLSRINSPKLKSRSRLG